MWLCIREHPAPILILLPALESKKEAFVCKTINRRQTQPQHLAAWTHSRSLPTSSATSDPTCAAALTKSIFAWAQQIAQTDQVQSSCLPLCEEKDCWFHKDWRNSSCFFDARLGLTLPTPSSSRDQNHRNLGWWERPPQRMQSGWDSWYSNLIRYCSFSFNFISMAKIHANLGDLVG